MADYEEELLEPLKLYKYQLSYKHQDNIDEFFDDLTRKSGVDIAANKETCDAYYKYLAELNQIKRKLGGKRSLRGFLIFSTIFNFIARTVLLLLVTFQVIKIYPAVFISLGVLLIVIGVLCIVINCVFLSKEIEKYQQIIDNIQKKADEKLQLAKEQMNCLNALFDWGIPAKIMNKTTPIIHLDETYDVEKYKYLVGNFKMIPDNGDNVSAICVQSGTLLDNPFLYERDYVMHMIQKTYTGSITITWTTYQTDSKGNTHAVHHTQTLTATISKPATSFFKDTALIYGNEAAPRLSFSRGPSEGSRLTGKQMDKFVAKTEKKLQKMQESKIKSSFTPLGNAKFEGLFNSFNRDNEVEFRLLFTPLAQKNFIDLLTSNKPYGDDFSFTKKKMINIIHSGHAQSLSFNGNPNNFYHYDYEKCKEEFTRYNMQFFQGIFFDFMPLLSIPLYQQHKDYVKEYYKGYNGNITQAEAEILANYFDENLFKADDCNTSNILKARHVTKINQGDIFEITAYGFRREPRVDYVSKMGGDGFMHTIPVPWEEYIPVEKKTLFAVINTGGTKQIYREKIGSIVQQISTYSKSNDIIYQRGLLSFVLRDGINHIDTQGLINIFKQ